MAWGSQKKKQPRLERRERNSKWVKERETGTIWAKTLKLEASKGNGLTRTGLAGRRNMIHQTQGKRRVHSQPARGLNEKPCSGGDREEMWDTIWEAKMHVDPWQRPGYGVTLNQLHGGITLMPCYSIYVSLVYLKIQTNFWCKSLCYFFFQVVKSGSYKTAAQS